MYIKTFMFGLPATDPARPGPTTAHRPTCPTTPLTGATDRVNDSCFRGLSANEPGLFFMPFLPVRNDTLIP